MSVATPLPSAVTPETGEVLGGVFVGEIDQLALDLSADDHRLRVEVALHVVADRADVRGGGRGRRMQLLLGDRGGQCREIALGDVAGEDRRLSRKQEEAAQEAAFLVGDLHGDGRFAGSRDAG